MKANSVIEHVVVVQYNKWFETYTVGVIASVMVGNIS